MDFLGEQEITLEEIANLGINLIGPDQINEFFGTQITLAECPLPLTQEQLANYVALLKKDFQTENVEICLCLMQKKCAGTKINLEFFIRKITGKFSWNKRYRETGCPDRLGWERKLSPKLPFQLRYDDKGQLGEGLTTPEFFYEGVRQGWILFCLKPNPLYAKIGSFMRKSNIRGKQEVILNAVEIAYLMLMTEKFLGSEKRMKGEFLASSTYKGEPVVVSNGKLKAYESKHFTPEISFNPTFFMDEKSHKPLILNYEDVSPATGLLSELP